MVKLSTRTLWLIGGLGFVAIAMVNQVNENRAAQRAAELAKLNPKHTETAPPDGDHRVAIPSALELLQQEADSGENTSGDHTSVLSDSHIDWQSGRSSASVDAPSSEAENVAQPDSPAQTAQDMVVHSRELNGTKTQAKELPADAELSGTIAVPAEDAVKGSTARTPVDEVVPEVPQSSDSGETATPEASEGTRTALPETPQPESGASTAP